MLVLRGRDFVLSWISHHLFRLQARISLQIDDESPIIHV